MPTLIEYTNQEYCIDAASLFRDLCLCPIIGSEMINTMANISIDGKPHYIQLHSYRQYNDSSNCCPIARDPFVDFSELGSSDVNELRYGIFEFS